MAVVAVIGTGWVGSSVAISTLHAGFASELWLTDARPGLAEGEAMDLAHGVTFYPPCTVRAVSLEETIEADAVVIAAGRGGRPGESRLALLKDNVALARDIGQVLRGSRGLVVVVTNPVDVLTAVVREASGLPPARVLGTGTMLDTARLRHVVGRELDLDARSVHVHIVGEHGDSQVALFSSARAGGIALRRFPGWDPSHEPALAAEVRGAAGAIIARKGATNHAIGLVTAALLRAALRGERRALTVSRVQEGALGLRDVAISLPAIVDRDGAGRVLQPDLDPGEREALLRSAEIVRAAAAGI